MRYGIIVGLLLLLGGPAHGQVFDDEDDGADLLLEMLQRVGERNARQALRSPDRLGWTHNRRDARAAYQMKKTLATRKAVAIDFEEEPLLDVIESLRIITGFSIVLTNKATEHIEQENPTVTLHLKDIPLQAVVDLVFELSSEELCYTCRYGVLMVGLKSEFKPRQVIDFYDVSDLVKPRPDFPAPRLALPDPERDD